jgi:hypothetical protein
MNAILTRFEFLHEGLLARYHVTKVDDFIGVEGIDEDADVLGCLPPPACAERLGVSRG